MLGLVSVALLVVVGLLLAHAIAQSKALRTLDGDAAGASAEGAGASVSVVVPARNEASNIGPCLARLLDQRGLTGRMRIAAVDDGSSDATPEILHRAARGDARLTAVSAPPLPQGWLGKPHACQTGYAALGGDGDWLCFIDADVRAAPRLLAAAIAAAEAEELDLLSLAPQQVLGSFAERLILPIGFYLLAFRQNLRKLHDPADPGATAAGLFILVRRSAYEAAGGHAATRACICEDTELARRVKATGGKVAMWGGDGLLEARMYRGLASLWQGLAKNVVDMLGGPVATLATILVANAVVWASIGLPIAAGLELAEGGGAGAAAALAASGVALGVILGFHVAGARHFGSPVWYGLLYPLAYATGSLIALDSLRRRLAGEVSWKGRVYHPPRHAGPGE